MAFEMILYEKSDGIATITLNRPKALNALSTQLKTELAQAFEMAGADKEILVVILTGGSKCFCAGADIKERSSVQMSQADAYFFRLKNHQFYKRIEEFEKPVIAAVSGVAVGGGCELTLVCDLRIASQTACFGVPEVKLGMIPAAGGTQRLPRIIGVTKAKELLFTGEFMDAKEAYRVGLVNKVVEVDELMTAARELARKLIDKPPLAVKFAKRTVNAGMQMDLNTALDYESHCASLLSVSEDRVEGFKAFVEKRKPVFKGR